MIGIRFVLFGALMMSQSAFAGIGFLNSALESGKMILGYIYPDGTKQVSEFSYSSGTGIKLRYTSVYHLRHGITHFRNGVKDADTDTQILPHAQDAVEKLEVWLGERGYFYSKKVADQVIFVAFKGPFELPERIVQTFEETEGSTTAFWRKGDFTLESIVSEGLSIPITHIMASEFAQMPLSTKDIKIGQGKSFVEALLKVVELIKEDEPQETSCSACTIM